MPVKCTPERVKNVIRKVNHKKLVLAHFGANEMCPQVYDELCGEDVYFDTAYVLRFTSKEDFRKIVKKHGEDKILFATDSPWSSIKNDADILKYFSLDKNVEEKIFYKNAEKLLGI
jgi:predicted TIM-barrel fold metal-dependent hydrolase